MQLRPYQTETLNAIAAAFQRGVTRQLVALPTGCGKTVIFSNLPSALRGILPGQVLVLAHREELLDQAADKLRAWNPHLTVSIEQAHRHADPSADVVVASVPTLGRTNSLRAGRFAWDNFSACVVDEAHHAVAQTYRNIFEMGGFSNRNKLLLGVTATPERGDGVGLEEVFEEITYNYGLLEAIADGWLCDLKALTVQGRADLDRVHTRAGDFANDELADAVDTPERNETIVKAWLEHADSRPTLAFTVNVKHAQNLSEVFRYHGVESEAVWGDDPERAAKVSRLRSGATQVLCNCNLLTEGFDYWGIACIVLARPTKSPLLFRQMVGRGTRIPPDVDNLNDAIARGFDGKTDCLLLDVVDSTRRHDLCTVPTLLGLPSDALSEGDSLKRLKQILDRNPDVDFSKLRDLSEIDLYVEQVQVKPVAAMPNIERMTLKWNAIGTQRYVLFMPGRETISVRQDMLNNWRLKTPPPNALDLSLPTLQGAIVLAEQWVKRYKSHAVRLLSTDEQKWHGLKPTEKQVAFITKWCRGVDPSTLSRKSASDLMSSKIAEWQR